MHKYKVPLLKTNFPSFTSTFLVPYLSEGQVYTLRISPWELSCHVFLVLKFKIKWCVSAYIATLIKTAFDRLKHTCFEPMLKTPIKENEIHFFMSNKFRALFSTDMVSILQGREALCHIQHLSRPGNLTIKVIDSFTFS